MLWFCLSQEALNILYKCVTYNISSTCWYSSKKCTKFFAQSWTFLEQGELLIYTVTTNLTSQDCDSFKIFIFFSLFISNASACVFPWLNGLFVKHKGLFSPFIMQNKWTVLALAKSPPLWRRTVSYICSTISSKMPIKNWNKVSDYESHVYEIPADSF